MSMHEKVSKHLETYVAGGLSPSQRERIERHVAECEECAHSLQNIRALDGKLGSLFADAQPKAALEDRLIQRLRVTAFRRRLPMPMKAAFAAAAVFLLAVLGAGLSGAMEEKMLWFPGEKGKAYRLGAELNAAKKIDDDRSYYGVLSAGYVDDTLMHGHRQHGLNISVLDDANSFISGLLPHGSISSELKDANTLANELKKRSDPSTTDNLEQLAVSGLPLFQGAVEPGGDVKNHSVKNYERELEQNKEQLAKAQFESATKMELAKQLESGLKGHSTSGKENANLDGVKSHFGEVGEKSAFSSDGKALELSSTNGAVKIWSLPTGKDLFFNPARIFTDRAEKNSANPLKMPDSAKQKLKVADINPADPNDVSGTPLDTGKGNGEQPPGNTKQGPGTVRKIIRSGEMEFEVKSFDDAVKTITKLIGDKTKGGFIATINSEKLPNGKMRGSVVVRIPAVDQQLEVFIDALRKGLKEIEGELLSQRIGSQDITKQYTDMESRLRAARTMEERLLKIIKDGKGEIKDLVAAEKELGVWRTKIEELEGELRYYENMVSLSTLTINLAEKEISAAARVVVSEQVKVGVEVDDVETARDIVVKAVEDAGGRVTRKEFKQYTAGQYNVILEFEVAPEKDGPIRDVLAQIGNIARKESEWVQHTADGGDAPANGKKEKGNTHFLVSLYNLASVDPRETVTLKLAAVDVAAAYRKLHSTAIGNNGRILDAQLNEKDQENVTATLDIHIHRKGEAALVKDIAEATEVLSRHAVHTKESENTTDAKVMYQIALVPSTAMAPRRTVLMAIKVNDVDATLTLLAAHLKEADGRVITSSITREEDGTIAGKRVFGVPLTGLDALVEKFKTSGQVYVFRSAEDADAPGGKFARARIDVTVSNTALLVPEDESLWTQVQKGLSISLRGLSMSVSWLIVAILFVLPWLLLLLGGIWLLRRIWGGGQATVTSTTPAATPAAGESS